MSQYVYNKHIATYEVLCTVYTYALVFVSKIEQGSTFFINLTHLVNLTWLDTRITNIAAEQTLSWENQTS